MRRKTICVKLDTLQIPCHTFDEGEYIEVMPRYALSMGMVDEMAKLLRTDIGSNTSMWLRECFKRQVISWELNLENADNVPLPKDSDMYEEALDKGILLLFACLVSQLKVGNEIIKTEWGAFVIGPDGTCTLVDDDKKK